MCQEQGDTLMHVAARCGHKKIVKVAFSCVHQYEKLSRMLTRNFYAGTLMQQ